MVFPTFHLVALEENWSQDCLLNSCNTTHPHTRTFPEKLCAKKKLFQNYPNIYRAQDQIKYKLRDFPEISGKTKFSIRE